MTIRTGILTSFRTENTESTYANRYFNQFSYDANGNIINQDRYGETGGIIDQFHYLYDSLNSCSDATMRTVRNRLESVVNTSSGSLDSMDFAYDAIGNLVKEDSAQIDTIYWTVSGKIKEIVRTTSSTMKGLRFDYDPSGNRIAKHVYASNNTLETSTYYVRDAQGNILSTYELSPGSYMVKEREIYGSSRLGITKDSLELVGVDPVCSITNFNRPIGLKRYELTNHLGNVLATISDRKLPYSSNTTTIDFYQPDILSANDYYPFGMMMVGRSFSASEYRFGFNGKENDNEVKGQGSQQDYGMRIYSPKLGRFLSIDPLYYEFPQLTPYQFSSNNPIMNVDIDGLEGTAANGASTISPQPRTIPLPRIIPLPSPVIRVLGSLGVFIQIVNNMPMINFRHIKKELKYDGFGLGILLTTGQVDVGKVADVPDLSGKSIKEAEEILKANGFEGGPKYDKDGNEKKNRDREYTNSEDDSKIRIKSNGDVVRHSKTRKDLQTGQPSNSGEKLIKDKDGEFKATRDQDIIHDNRPSNGGSGEAIQTEKPISKQ
ncbi:MAG: PASTA domain-containing protein [Bacteroidetes bacterium]|nr:MAG: PASTA domain-containing protein [Bacteroidota bacterium]